LIDSTLTNRYLRINFKIKKQVSIIFQLKPGGYKDFSYPKNWSDMHSTDTQNRLKPKWEKSCRSLTLNDGI